MGAAAAIAIMRLKERQVVASPGLYYLDEEVWIAVRRDRRRHGVIIGSILALIFLGLAVGFLKW